jgi:glycosyltransferase involved in cell wall biosynthesis
MQIHLSAHSRMRRDPHVAVVVPCYNYGRYLSDCVLSIVNQPGVTVEVIIIDDASTDDSEVVGSRLANQYPQVRLIRHRTNMGHIATYNEGLRQVDSDYVVLLSADDMLAAGSLQRAAALMDAYPGVGMVYGHPQNFATTPEVQMPRLVTWSVWKGTEWIRLQFRRGLSCVYSPEAVVRTSVQHQVGYYDPSLPATGDLEMWLRIAATADIGRINGADQAYRRVHPSSMMHTRFSGLLVDTEERVRAYSHHLEAHVNDDGDALRRVMERRASQAILDWARTKIVSGTASSSEVDGARMLAARLDPAAPSGAGWKDLDVRITGGTTTERLACDVRDYVRRKRDALRWRRWRYLGV